jgi:hypothetical protein
MQDGSQVCDLLIEKDDTNPVLSLLIVTLQNTSK